MTKLKTTKIRGLLTSVTSQRTQFKPYGYNLDFTGGTEEAKAVYVELDVPEETVIQEEGYYVVLDMNGLNVVLKTLADSIDKLDIEFKRKYSGG